MRELTLGGLEVRLAGGPDREGGGDGPLLVLFHGFGAPGTDLVPLWRSLRVPPEVRFAFPAAPLVLEPSSRPELAPRAWWMIDIARLQSAVQAGREAALALAKEPPPPGLAEARARVEEFLDACETSPNYGGADNHTDPGYHWQWCQYMERLGGSREGGGGHGWRQS